MVGLRLPSNLKAAHLGGLSASELKNDSMSLSERQLKIHRLPRVAPPKRSEGGEWRAKRSLGSGDPPPVIFTFARSNVLTFERCG